jgi:putative peptidoglycan lipid II flippase
MNLLRALATTSSMTLLSRILGYVRDAMIAHTFGAGGLTDAFFVAFRLPNLLRRLFAEGAFSQAFVPILAEYKTRAGHDATRNLVDHTATALCVALFITTLLGVIFAPQVIWISAPGFSSDSYKFSIAVQLLQVTFPYILFISLVSLAAGVLNTYHQFWVPAFTPVLLNLSFIACALLLAPWLDTPIMALAWGAFLGGVLQLLFQLPFLKRINMLPRLRWDLSDPGLRRILGLMGPAVVGVSVGQVSLLISTMFASYLPSGSVSWLFYADRLMEFPTGLLGAALGTILLPSLVKHHTDGDQERYSSLLDWGLRVTLLLTLPAAVGLAVCAVPLISTLFLRGAFGAHDLWQVREALLAYSLGLTGLIAVKILAPAYYARQDMRTPVRIAIFTLVICQVMNAFLIGPFAHAGLALSTGLGACINAGLLLRGLLHRKIYSPQAGWGIFILKLTISLCVLSSVLWWLSQDINFWLNASSWQRVLRMILIMVAASVSYFGTLALLGFRLKDFNRRAA